MNRNLFSTFNRNRSPYLSEKEGMLSIRKAVFLFGMSLFIGVVGFMVVEGYNFVEAVFMTIITISTVGFGEVQPLSETGRIFTSIYIIVNIGVYAYAASAFSKYIIEGEIFKNRFLKSMDKKIQHLNNHVIVCGFGKYGYEICHHFDSHNTPFVVIEQKEETMKKAASKIKDLHWLIGDATTDEELIRAGIKRAKTIIAATGDDSENLFIVLSARQLNKKIDIISRAVEQRSEKKMYLAGADHVIMPDQIGGFYMAVLVSKPDVVEFFSFMANETQTNISFEEIHYEDFATNMQGKRLRDLNIRSYAGANVIGLRKPDGSYEANPTPENILQPGESYIVIGNKSQIAKLDDCLGDGGE